MVDPSKSWIPYSPDSHFPLQNIPFGVFFNPKEEVWHCCTRIGDSVIDLGLLETQKLFDGDHFSKLKRTVFARDNLNDFIALGKEYWSEARMTIQSLFTQGNPKVSEDMKKVSIFPFNDVKMKVPCKIGDYTDFYSSKNHAYNVGVMFRGPDNALQPNWVHLPVGYHGRASSIVVSGTPVRRPKGQVSADKVNPSWSTCNRLDIELEMGAFVGKSNELGHPVKVKDANEHIFGYCLLNDWSARDL